MGRFLRSFYFIFTLSTAVFLPFLTQGAMSSTNYQIRFDTVGVGGADTSASTSYKVRDSLEFMQGTASSATYRVDQGYRGGIYDPAVRFNVIAQDTASQVAATAITSTSVTVTATTGFAVNDYIVVIQDEGVNQVTAMGRITSIAGLVITVDYFQYGASLPIINGSSDYVYELTGSSVPLTSITPRTVSTGIFGWDVDADLPTGYNVFVREDQDFQTASAQVLNDVDDGAVSAGVEEYGGRSSDLTLTDSTFDTADTNFTTTLQKVASRTNSTLKARDFLTLKVAAAETTIDGAYSHTLTVIFIGEY